eukprot:TRINITY_DN1510_c0_g1_i4.p4 TRINITY_DN1510_c0_g1~~TRINITY_DN1510_c0_g1_i4.p4  ORF type:complete len:112 (+),score=3.61 TRINITY_DN1510_c0_g1_i4:502-837(+)
MDQRKNLCEFTCGGGVCIFKSYLRIIGASGFLFMRDVRILQRCELFVLNVGGTLVQVLSFVVNKIYSNFYTVIFKSGVFDFQFKFYGEWMSRFVGNFCFRKCGGQQLFLTH